MHDVISRSEILARDWSEQGSDPLTNPYRTRRQLNQAHWMTNPRPSHAPTLQELRDMVFKQTLELKINQRQVAERAGLDTATICRTLKGKTSPNYTTVVKTCNAVGIEVTVTQPGNRFLGTKKSSSDPASAGQPGSLPPTPDEIGKMAAIRLEELKAWGVTLKPIRTHREDVKEHQLERLRHGDLAAYEKLRTMLAAVEIELVIKPAGHPLPEPLRYARFTADSRLPVIQMAEHDTGTSIHGNPITELPAPWDLADGDARYVISPDDRMEPAGIRAGEYCLAGNGNDATEREWQKSVYLELTDGMRMLGQRLNDRVPEKAPMNFLRWGTGEEEYKATLMEIPNDRVSCILPILAIYEGRPNVDRPPAKRVLELT